MIYRKSGRDAPVFLDTTHGRSKIFLKGGEFMKEHERRLAGVVTFWEFIKFVFWVMFSLEAMEERELFYLENPHLRQSEW